MGDSNQKKPVKRVVRTAPSAEEQKKAAQQRLVAGQTSKTSSKSAKSKTSGKSKKSKKRQRPVGVRVLTKTLGIIGKTIAALFLLMVIVGCIAATALTVFVMKYVDSESTYDLNNVQTTYTTNIIGLSAGQEVIIQSISNQGNREWLDITEIPEYVQDATICAEDKRFFEHEGVDWPRTFAAFTNMMLGYVGLDLGFDSGASTITQQLIKNINADFYNREASTKVKEILAALNLEKTYSKQQILGAYMNYISLGYNNYGIEAGAEYYFGKSTQELTIAEAASLACITKSPAYYNPIDGPEDNKERRSWVLKTMLEEEYITQEEYDQAINEDIQAALIPHDGTVDDGTDDKGYYSWAVDATMHDVAEDLADQEGWDYETAISKLKSGGYSIYTKIDIDLQNQLESITTNPDTFNSWMPENPPDAAVCVMDYEGNVVAQVGSRHPKTGYLGDSKVFSGMLNVGSCMKPLAAYAPALQNDLIYWDQVRKDEPKLCIDDDTGEIKKGGKANWPNNWNDSFSGNITIVDALRWSKNTIPVELEMQMGLESVQQWLEHDLGISTVDYAGDGYATTLGNMTNGIHLDEFTAGYLMFGNNGVHHDPKNYTIVYDSKGEVVLEADTAGNQALDSDTAYIMNRLLRTVIAQSGSTGTAASLDSLGIEVIGKTGTGEDKGLAFVGATPYHVSSIWMGYDDNSDIDSDLVYSPARVWYNIFSQLYATYEPKDFSYLDDSGVIQKNGGYYKAGVATGN